MEREVKFGTLKYKVENEKGQFFKEGQLVVVCADYHPNPYIKYFKTMDGRVGITWLGDINPLFKK